MNRDFMKIDTHMHTCFSGDAITKPETLMKTAKEKGITPCITDHNSVKAWPRARAFAKKIEWDFIPGEEILAYCGDDKAGEIIGLFMIAPVKGRQYQDVLDELRAQDALVVIPHPFDKFRLGFRYIEQIAGQIDLLEVFNPRTQNSKYNDVAKRFAEKHSLPMVAGSDAHTPEEIGNAYTEIAAHSLEEARKVLLSGKTKIYGKKGTLKDHFITQLAKHKIIGER
jgi:predicted metal-dependent phosphoesterase TrpH